ncbi:hypothetical protein [Halorarum salinum]|uniref:Uncharacterized protein n=1 Tax=Halorarum salinum TaxID=2743089 RepID=A0A7D5LCJ4_9EURY|nr:hypothetical protein [Halobaculum salinum]QLG63207.1 hypothetical protein HUG12_16290 [Halobaculum salinum]
MFHVCCRDCPFEGLASSFEQAERAVDAHGVLEEDHRAVFGEVDDV